MASGSDLSPSEYSIDTTMKGASNAANMVQLMKRTGYDMMQQNGQRKYGGPPPNWTGPAPGKGCEVFVGKIPRDLYEDELVPVFEKCGQIYELRLMMDFSNHNRGYAFVMYTTKVEAQNSQKRLNNYEIRKGRFIGVCMSIDNCRLFVGGIPKNKTKEEILDEMKKVTEGVVDVIVYPSITDKTKNRGFAFVEYESHRAAAMARRKLIPGRIQLWAHQIAVDWAEPEVQVDEEVMQTVKVLYVRNLMLNTSEESLEREFSKLKPGSVERVKKIRDYAFIHFTNRDDALQAMQEMDNSIFEGARIETTLAKPVDKDNYVRYTRSAGRGGLMVQGGAPGISYPAMFPDGRIYEHGFSPVAQYITGPPMYGSQIAPQTMALGDMMEDLTIADMPESFSCRPRFPSARPGGNFALMNRGGMRGRGRSAAGMRGAGVMRYLNSMGRAVYQPMRPRKPSEGYTLYEILPGMDLTPTNPHTLKPHLTKPPPQILEEVCGQNNWGSPVYSLHSTVGSQDMQLFLYKVSITIPAQNNQYPTTNQFQPHKLCRTVEEAKNFAAEYVLGQLGVPIDTAAAGDPVSIPTPYAQQAITQGAGNEHMYQVPQGPEIHYSSTHTTQAADHVPATNYQFVPPMTGI